MKEREGGCKVAQWRSDDHGFNPLHSTMTSGKLRDMYGVIESGENSISNSRRVLGV